MAEQFRFEQRQPGGRGRGAYDLYRQVLPRGSAQSDADAGDDDTDAVVLVPRLGLSSRAVDHPAVRAYVAASLAPLAWYAPRLATLLRIQWWWSMVITTFAVGVLAASIAAYLWPDRVPGLGEEPLIALVVLAATGFAILRVLALHADRTRDLPEFWRASADLKHRLQLLETQWNRAGAQGPGLPPRLVAALEAETALALRIVRAEQDAWFDNLRSPIGMLDAVSQVTLGTLRATAAAPASARPEARALAAPPIGPVAMGAEGPAHAALLVAVDHGDLDPGRRAGLSDIGTSPSVSAAVYHGTFGGGWDVAALGWLPWEGAARRPATVTAVLAALERLRERAVLADHVLLVFCGHGVQQFVPGFAEDDERREALVCADGLLTEDDLRARLEHFPPHVRLTVVLDCCHAAGMADLADSSRRLVSRLERALVIGAAAEWGEEVVTPGAATPLATALSARLPQARTCTALRTALRESDEAARMQPFVATTAALESENHDLIVPGGSHVG